MDFNILDYGVLASGKEINTKIIKFALYACAEAGDGRVIVSKGIYMSGNIILKINVNLHVEETGVLLGFLDCVVKNTVSKRLNSYLWCF